LLLAHEAVLTTWHSERYVTDAAMFALNKSVRESSPWLMTLPRNRHTDTVISVAWSPDGQRIVTGSYDNTARVWDTNSGAELLLASLVTPARVSTAAFSPDGSRILSAS
jgi:WD40 repeat protein